MEQNTAGCACWTIAEPGFSPEHLAKYETVLTLGNGYLGQRAALDEAYVGQTRNLFVCGTFDRYHTSEVSELPNLPDVTRLDLFVNGERFSLLTGTTLEHERSLDLYTAELHRKARWRAPDGAELTLRWWRMVSTENPHLMASAVEITPDRAVELTLSSGIDGRMTNSGTQHLIEGNSRVLDGGVLQYPAQTLQSGIRTVTHAAHRIFLDGEACAVSPKITGGRRYLGVRYTLTVPAGHTLRLEKLSAIHTARDEEYAHLSPAEANRRVLPDALADFRRLASENYETHFRRSAANWAEFWKQHDISVCSENDFDQKAIRFAIYHLHLMANPIDSRIGVAAKGLTGEGYKGHSFWDTEIFVLPCYLYTNPELARRLLEYRYRNLAGARRSAQREGCRGARFPWEAGWIEDGDVTPDTLGVDLITGKQVPCETGKIELHVTADVAYTVQRYYEATGDRRFMERCGYEMLLETALYWADRLEAHDGWYELTHVIGPDEYQVDVDNNAYTNHLAAWNLRYGMQAAEQVTGALKTRLEQRLGSMDALRTLFAERLEKLYLPAPDPETGLIEQFDGYYQKKFLDLRPYKETGRVAEILRDYSFEDLNHYQAAKQADVVQLLYLAGRQYSDEIRRKNYLYYEPRTLHDSSLSRAIHSILASDLGMGEEAYRMFRGAAETDLGNISDSCDNGIHAANMGGIWQAVVMGFGGVRQEGGRLTISPHLPPQWRELHFDLSWQGRLLEITVTQTEMRISNGGEELGLQVCGKNVSLFPERVYVFGLGGEEA